MGIRDVLFAVATGGILESALEGSAEAVALYLGRLMQAAFLSVPLQLLDKHRGEGRKQCAAPPENTRIRGGRGQVHL